MSEDIREKLIENGEFESSEYNSLAKEVHPKKNRSSNEKAERDSHFQKKLQKRI